MKTSSQSISLVNSQSSRVAAIIVTYNAGLWIDRCLSSIFSSVLKPLCIVIDNASGDNTLDIIKSRFSEVVLISSPKNLGFGAANNLGIKYALEQKADYVLLLNQDAWIADDMLQKMIAAFSNSKTYGLLSPFHLNYEGTAIERYFEDWVLNHYTQAYEATHHRQKLPEILTCSFVHAACWLLPRSTIQEVGGFDPVFFHYGEDNDFIQRLKSRGLVAGIVPSATVYHYGTNDGLVEPQKNVRHLTNQILLQIKNPEASHAGALFLFLKQFIKAMLSGPNTPSGKAYRAVFSILPRLFRSRFRQKNELAFL